MVILPDQNFTVFCISSFSSKDLENLRVPNCMQIYEL